MSRIGRKPIPIPAGVEVQHEGNTIRVSGPKGKLEWSYPSLMEVEISKEKGMIFVRRPNDQKQTRALHGLTRQLVANMVEGVHRGFEKKLSINGVGYNAKVQGGKLQLNIGFCHPVLMEIPKDLEVEVPNPTSIVVRGADKQKVGQFAANIRRIRPPEPYKGKGIRYHDEVVRRKAGKSLAGG
ncbi:MAG: 50S ribosomal protein L6 [Planctomycetota bacterium]|nr:MAG: 50S ribosomal protein L6 [Planctomycetota bacterium]